MFIANPVIHLSVANEIESIIKRLESDITAEGKYGLIRIVWTRSQEPSSDVPLI